MKCVFWSLSSIKGRIDSLCDETFKLEIWTCIWVFLYRSKRSYWACYSSCKCVCKWRMACHGHVRPIRNNFSFRTTTFKCLGNDGGYGQRQVGPLRNSFLLLQLTNQDCLNLVVIFCCCPHNVPLLQLGYAFFFSFFFVLSFFRTHFYENNFFCF